MDFDTRIHALVRAALLELPAADGALYKRVVTGVERELLEQIMPTCDNNRSKAATRLGINRNTLYKKLNDLRIPAADPVTESA